LVQAADLLVKDLGSLLAALAAQARRHKRTLMIGRTHGMHAEPTTFGLKLAVFYDEFQRQLERLVRERREISVGKISGAVARTLLARHANFLNSGMIRLNVSIHFSGVSLKPLRRLYGLTKQAQAKRPASLFLLRKKVGKGSVSKWQPGLARPWSCLCLLHGRL
jgi:aspartate ammonia-lyase